MRRIKLAITILLSTIILTSMMAVAGCGDEGHGDHFRGRGDHHPEYRHDGGHDRH